jgi:type I restriction enzyme, S subunit
MSKERNISFGPKLRFPAFAKKATWKERNLSEVLFEHDERSTGKEEVFSVSVHKGVVNQIEHLGRSFSAANTDNYKRVLPGDIIYTKSPTGDFPYGIIKQSKVSKPVIVSPLYGVFKPETTALGVILDAYFEYPRNVYNYLYSIIQKGAKNTINITNETFLSKTLILPTDKDEQQKIADCLSSLDALNTAENQKLEALRLHKKGLMQQLFPAEGEKVPRLRLATKSGKPWTKIPFNEAFTRLTTKNTENNQNVLTISAKDGLVSQLDYFNKAIAARDVSGYYLLNKGDFAYNKSYSNGYPMGAIKALNRYDKGVVSTLYICFRANQGFNVSFFEQYFDSGMHNNEIGRIAQEGARNHGLLNVGVDDFFNLNLLIPSDSIEQQKIADCLSSINYLITKQEDKVELLKMHKKGLMQQLFPDVNAAE